MNEQVKALGFTYVGSSLLSAEETRTYFSLYFNSEDQYVSMLVTCENKTVQTTYLEFAQLYTDGSMLDIHNSDVVGVYPRMLQKIAAYYPAIKDPEALYSIFKKMSSNLISKGKVVARDSFTGFDTIEKYMALESDELVKLKYCNSEISDDGMRALTIKGAYMLTWRSVFPGKKIQAVINSNHANKMLRDA